MHLVDAELIISQVVDDFVVEDEVAELQPGHGLSLTMLTITLRNGVLIRTPVTRFTHVLVPDGPE
jgi:hypothetical protein